MKDTPWHILDTGSIWLKEFACALGESVPTFNWVPAISNFGHWESGEQIVDVADPAVQMIRFPLQRGYARFPLNALLPFEKSMVERLRAKSVVPQQCSLICTAPFYAPVAEQWPGPVVYYLTDLTLKYAGMNPKQIIGLDRRMCSVATTVCPNSTRIADYLCDECRCDRQKITVIPNATRQQNVLDCPLLAPENGPADLADIPRPMVGVIGNLAGNMDWLLIRDCLEATRDVSWVFVGPTTMAIPDMVQEEARRTVMRLGNCVRFLGARPYGQLAAYARAFDVALLPYRKQEPTYSGSATRFYEHLAACRPILATRGFHELLTKEPLLALVDSANEVAEAIKHLRENKFRDGFEELRWRASQHGTWQTRARDLLAAAEQRHKKRVA